MLELVVVLAAVSFVTVIPVVVGARVIGARRTEFVAALSAVAMQAALGAATKSFSSSAELAVLAAIVGGTAIYAIVLETTLLRGLFIGLIGTAIGIVVLMILTSTVPIGRDLVEAATLVPPTGVAAEALVPLG
ncbi:MAG TPA: hypothetical protein VF265_07665 [Nevskiaceae bacterium]